MLTVTTLATRTGLAKNSSSKSTDENHLAAPTATTNCDARSLMLGMLFCFTGQSCFGAQRKGRAIPASTAGHRARLDTLSHNVRRCARCRYIYTFSLASTERRARRAAGRTCPVNECMSAAFTKTNKNKKFFVYFFYNITAIHWSLYQIKKEQTSWAMPEASHLSLRQFNRDTDYRKQSFCPNISQTSAVKMTVALSKCIWPS